MHPQNKMQGSDPFYFHFIFIFFILKGAPAPPFYFCTPDGARPGAPAQSGNHPGSCSLKDPVVWSGWELPHYSFVDVCRPPLAVALLLGEQ